MVGLKAAHPEIIKMVPAIRKNDLIFLNLRIGIILDKFNYPWI